MLILRRKEGQWLDITHRSGDVIRIRVCNIRSRYPGQLDLVLDDAARNFLVHRPERPQRSTLDEHPPEQDLRKAVERYKAKVLDPAPIDATLPPYFYDDVDLGTLHGTEGTPEPMGG